MIVLVVVIICAVADVMFRLHRRESALAREFKIKSSARRNAENCDGTDDVQRPPEAPPFPAEPGRRTGRPSRGAQMF